MADRDSLDADRGVRLLDTDPGEPVTAPAPIAPGDLRTAPARFLNREISWLDWNARVLALAEDDTAPLLERLKFLAIFATNLDEFFMVRVAGLIRRMETGLGVRSADGLSTRRQLELIRQKGRGLAHEHARVFLDDVRPALAASGITILGWDDLSAAEQLRLHGWFRERVFPVLTPLAVDPAHPFPYISGLSLNLAVLVRDPETGVERFARVKVPNNVDRFVEVDAVEAGTSRFLPLEELIGHHLGQLFPGLDVLAHHPFRVTRNADLEVEEDRDEDLLQALERELSRRRFGPVVRVEVGETMDPHVLELLVRELDITTDDVVAVPGLLALSSLMELMAIDRPELKDEPFVPATHPRLVDGEQQADVFAALREGDILVHHPYDSFSTSVQRFLEQAAADPQVLAIKQTLYRTSGDSPIVDALIDAAEAGKQVVVVIEITARFDEQANIRWARKLERAGCHVVYGLLGLKTHCKTALVVRQESGGLRRYCHLGTGNYHPRTARLYEDLGLLTADPELGADLTDLFNTLTGYSNQKDYRDLMVAPHGVRKGLVQRIRAEADNALAGAPAGIRIKANSVVDEDVIDALYEASEAGVPIDVVVRGICSLRPAAQGISSNIRVRSILGRFLEHSRVVEFTNGGEPEVWFGSADLMHRNLDRRVETLVRVKDPAVRTEVSGLLDQLNGPDVLRWDLDAHGEWHHRPDHGGTDIQTELLRAARESGPVS
ncbi:MAG: degradosome polyphosphate kinase [Frankiales bacterium]|nr:degradosome polyphosphate kinase [Frankiales bacterium]